MRATSETLDTEIDKIIIHDNIIDYLIGLVCDG
jgi:hypothetical protein